MGGGEMVSSNSIIYLNIPGEMVQLIYVEMVQLKHG